MRSTQTLNRIAPLHPPTLIPPEGSVPIGTTPDGKQLYQRVTRRSRAVADKDPVTGEQRWRTNLMGEKILPLFKPEFYNKEEVFWLHSQGNGTVEHIPYYPPTAEEVQQDKRRRDLAQMSDALTGAFVDAGYTPADLVEMLKARKAAETAEVAPEQPVSGPDLSPEVVTYPVHQGGRWWQLSDGQRFGGTRVDAEAAEKKVPDEAREAYAATKQALAGVPSY